VTPSDDAVAKAKLYAKTKMLLNTNILKVVLLRLIRNFSSNNTKRENAEYINVNIPHITR